ncbi:fungal-specific transcription factor domain-containing protein [Lasiosphaeria miniovina]|uniref:Fungal-specific transcription factor domain-containing protein n=1 Tax=Lasiosphaeria miniovina TaxID=1954250 RepID=A0AA40BGF3_9PEZI|nr:fungal-specific transcription factor domain-containing protein [Lasiosphaeria miniovina]KAK0733783.1 fungal-specific transcription factor domain-containing protein [Lasiosphaeria miniovina]
MDALDDAMDEDKPGDRPPPPAPQRKPPPATGKHPAASALSPSALSPTADPGSSTGSAQGASKRRRGLGVVTQNACTECRKKRAKCDGQTPCARCRGQKDVECVYEIPVRQSKETLRHEIDQLRRQQRSSEQVLSALARPDPREEVLTRLRNGQTVEVISEWLRADLASGTGSHPPGHGGGAPTIARFTSAGARGTSSYPVIAPGISKAMSPVSSQHPHSSMRLEAEQQSPWGGHFSSHSTTRSDSQAETMNWSSETVRGLPQSMVGSWLESQGQGSTSDPLSFRGLDQLLAPDLPEMRVPPGTWTTITADAGLVKHLLTLYFCWEYPTFASLSKEHFLRDFMEGRARFCSSILVNALLALGCRFSSRPSTRANPDDPHTSGDHFFKESQRLFYQEENHHSLTTIQALGIMSIREASCGRDSESWYYAGQSIRLAIEMGLHRLQDDGRDDDESAVQAATFWGAFALDHAWSLATGSLPQCSCFPRLPPKPAIIDDIEASLWIPYTDDGAPLQRSCEQPSNVRSVYTCFCELSELVHQSLYILHSPGRPLTSRDLLNIYTQYLNWYGQIPEVLRLGHNFTPAVLFAHMYYHFAILLLFRPLIKLRIIGSSISPRDVCSQAADAISGLLRSYSQLYTLRCTPSFVPYFVLTSSIMHLAIGATVGEVSAPTAGGGESTQGGQTPQSSHSAPARVPRIGPRVAEAISRGIADLTEMAPCHHFAEQALNILRFLVKKWNIDVDIHTTNDQELPPIQPPDYAQATRPVTSSLNFFAPNVMEADFNCTWGEGSPAAPGAATSPRPSTAHEMANASENPLFWPFPMQGRPILPTGQELEEAGFELL